MSLKLGMESILAATKQTAAKKNNVLFAIVNMNNAKACIDLAAKKVVSVICTDRKVREAVANLQAAKHCIKTYGASESIMAIFNEGNQLGNALRMEIPEITSINASSVGIACCEAIDEKVVEANALIKKFFEELCANVANFFEKLEEVTECQKCTLNGLAQDVLADIEAIDAEAFAREEVFGYAQKVFMERLAALNTLADKLGAAEPNAESVAEFKPVLEVLGYKVETAEAEIREETPAEQAAEAPAPETVMNPNPVAEPAPAVEPGQPEAPAQEDLEPADAPQEKNMAVFGWNPATIRDAVKGLIELLGKVGGLRPIKEKINELKTKAFAAIDKEVTPEAPAAPVENVPAATEPVEGTEPAAPAPTEPTATPEGEAPATEGLEGVSRVESYRIYAGFFGEAITLFQKNTNELVDQVVALCAKLKKVEVPPQAPEATPVESVTTEQPLGPEQPAEPAPTPEASAPTANEGGEIVEPDNVPKTEPLDTPKVDPETKPQPVGGAEHTEEVETPAEEQPKSDLPGEKANDRFWHF